MGRAFLQGFKTAGLNKKYEIVSSCRTQNSKVELEKAFSWPVFLENSAAASKASVLILGVKPFLVEEVLEEISEFISPDCVVVSLAAGVSIEQIHKKLAHVKNIVRVMPNMPATLGKGVLAYASSHTTDAEIESRVEELLQLLGKTFKIPERLMDAAAALSGGAPAYVAYFLEAMTQAGVQLGFSPVAAFEMVRESFSGSMALFEKDLSLRPAKLIEQVCTPGGTTIEGMGLLDQGAVKGSILKALNAAAQKSAFLGGRRLFHVEIPKPPKPVKLPALPKLSKVKKIGQDKGKKKKRKSP